MPASDRASTAAASSAALTAPALPMASVPTGMPAGIWTIESSESWPDSAFEFDRHAEHRQRRQRRRHAGQMRGAAGAGDDDLVAGSLGALGELVEPVGRAVRRDDPPVVATPSASSVSAAWRMVAQSDWLPMMMATSARLLFKAWSPQRKGRELMEFSCAARIAAASARLTRIRR